MRALSHERLGSLGRAHAAANARYRTARQQSQQVIVLAFAHSGIEVDHLDLGEGGEFVQHLERRAAFQRFVAALDQLDYLAVHEIDAG